MTRKTRFSYLVLSLFVGLGVFCSQTAEAQTRNVVGTQGRSTRQGGGLSSAAQSTLNLGADSLQSASGQGGLGTFTQQAIGASPGGQQGGFVGRGAGTGQFVGQGGQATQSQQLQQRRNDFAQFGRDRNGGNNQSRARSSGTQRVIRPRIRIAFEATQPSMNVAVTSLSGRFGRLSSRRPTLANVRFESDTEGEVTLQGSVSSEETRKLAEIMAGMQPGVRKVTNELTIVEAAAQP